MVATWLTSGWIDVALVTGWMAFVVGVGVAAWRRSEDDG